MSGVEWRGAGVTRECTWSGTIPRMNLIVIALNANFNSASSVIAIKHDFVIHLHSHGPSGRLKTSGFVLGFQQSLGTFRMLMNGKIMFDPSINLNK